MTLDDLERPKRQPAIKICNEDRSLLSAVNYDSSCWKYKVHQNIRGGSIGEGVSSTINANFEHGLVEVQRGVFILGTRRCELLATQLLATLKINIQSTH